MSSSSSTPPDLSAHLKDVEKAAEAVLMDKHEIVALDRKRNLNREAMRSVDREIASNWQGEDGKTWVAMGGANSFIQMPNRGVKEMIKKDQVRLDVEINSLRSELKVKVNSLREKEGRDELKGFGLKALSREEMDAVRNVIGPKPTWR